MEEIQEKRLIDLPAVSVAVEAFCVYFEKAAVITKHFYHGSKRIYLGNAEICTIIRKTYTLVRKILAGFVVPVVFVRKTAEQAAALSGNLHGIQRKILILCHFDGNRTELI